MRTCLVIGVGLALEMTYVISYQIKAHTYDVPHEHVMRMLMIVFLIAFGAFTLDIVQAIKSVK